MSTRRRLSTRGMVPVRHPRPLLDVDANNSYADDAKRRELCRNHVKFRRITQHVYLSLYHSQNIRNANKKIKLNKVENAINPFSLAKWAYMSCSTKEKAAYDKMQTPDIDVKECCYLLKSHSSDAMNHAIVHKHLECFKHGHKMGFDLPHWSCYIAIAHECVEILQYAYENDCDFVVDIAFKEAAVNGHLPCFEYIHKIGGYINVHLMKTVIIQGNLDCLKYLLRIGCEWTDDMCALSANSGNLDFVKFCQNNGCPWVVDDLNDWYVLVANLGLLLDNRSDDSQNLGMEMKKCARYIEETAEIEDQYKLCNHIGIQMLSIEL